MANKWPVGYISKWTPEHRREYMKIYMRKYYSENKEMMDETNRKSKNNRKSK